MIGGCGRERKTLVEPAKNIGPLGISGLRRGGMNEINVCCAECGADGGASLKMCKACMLVKYCNAECQHKHWPMHKAECKLRVAELRDEALFKDPPAKEDCPICFIPMPKKLICCVTLPPATTSSVPIYGFAEANEELAQVGTGKYYSCCGKSILDFPSPTTN